MAQLSAFLRTMFAVWIPVWVCCAASLLAQSQTSQLSSTTAVPTMVKFSGTVHGAPSRIMGVTFGLYKDQQGGAALWLETQSVTLDSAGHYTVNLGSTLPSGLPTELFTSGEARWLGVQSEGQVEQPRVLLLSVPYALKAADAATVGGLPPSAFVLAAPASSSSATEASNGTAGAPGPIPPSAPTVGGSGTTNFIPFWTDNADLGSSVLFQLGSGSTAKVGINTTAPAATLDVKGSATVRGLLTLPSAGVATATKGSNSQALAVTASAFNSTSKSAVNQNFRWQAEPAGNNTAAPSATMNLLFGSGTGNPTETGLKISNTGLFTFATGQTFPGTGTISGVTAGTGLTGGGSSGSVTLNLDTTNVPELNVSNTFTGNQTVSGNLSATGLVTGSSFQIGSDLFAYGSYANSNAFLGFGGSVSTTGTANTATGAQALILNGTGSQNTAIGSSALSSNTNGGANTAIGTGALSLNSTGSDNTASGTVALQANTTGSYNTANGIYALFTNTTGSFNSALGYLAGPDSSHANLNNSTAIGALATVTTSNSMVLGSIAGVNGAGSNTNVGIGTTSPLFTLDVHGTGNFTAPVTFASSQTFPNTISGVTAGSGLTGGGSSGNVTLNMDATKIPQLNVSNTFTGDQTVSGNLSSTGLMTSSGFQIGSNLFAFGSFANTNAFLGFAGNSTSLNVDNTAIGPYALAANTNGAVNTAIGGVALGANTTGGSNTATGFGALGLNSTGNWNTAMGVTSLSSNNGDFNAGFGADALAANSTGGENTAVGVQALFYNKTGSNNTALGYNAGPANGSTNLSNSTAIGAFSDVTASNAMVLGGINGVNGATASTNVGIGTTAPAFTLDVHGTGNFTGPITFASGQTFPGAGTITGVTAGTALSGGGSTGGVTLNVDTTKVVTGITAGTGLTGGGTGGVQTLNLDTTKVPQLSAANTFTNSQTVSGNLSATGVVSGSSYQIGSSLFAFGTASAENTFLGFAGNITSGGIANVGTGSHALSANTSGSLNTATGAEALMLNTTGGDNTATGADALFSNSSGSNNTAVGLHAMFDNDAGAGNTAVGQSALVSNTTGSNNVAVGASALYSNDIGSSNTAIGSGSGPAVFSLNNTTAVGANTQVAASNAMVLGSINGVGGASADTSVGIGTTAPASTLDIEKTAAATSGPILLLKNKAPFQSGALGNAIDIRFAPDGGSSVLNPNAYLRVQEDGNSQYGAFMSFATMADGGSGAGPLERMRITASGLVGIGTFAPTRTLSVGQGLGHMIADGYDTYSSRRWKTNIQTLPDALSKVEQLRGVSYDLKGSGKHEIGVIAEEVGQVVPEIVSYEANGKDAQGVDYTRLTAVLIEAVKQQQKQIAAQQRQIRTQQRQLVGLKARVGVLETSARTPQRTKAGHGGRSKLNQDARLQAEAKSFSAQ